MRGHGDILGMPGIWYAWRMNWICILILALGCSLASADEWYVSLDEPMHIRYRVEFHASMSDAEFAAMGRRINGRPEHPDRRTYEMERERREQGPSVVAHELWVDHRGVRRSNTSNTDDDLYFDAGNDGKTGWMLTRTGLTLVDDDAPSVPGQPDPTARLEEQTRDLGRFFTRGKTIASAVGVGEDAWVADGDALVVRNERLTLRLVDDGETVTITITGAQSPEYVGTGWSLEGEIEIGETGRMLPSVFNSFTAGGQLEQRVVLEEIRTISDSEIKAATRTPTVDGEDLVRGKLTFTMIQDHRGGEIVQETHAPDGTVSTERFNPSGRGWLRPVLWVCAGLIVVVLVWLRVRKGS